MKSLFAVGDVLAQSSSESFEKYDSTRTLRAWIYGGIVFAPIGTKWYTIVDKVRFPGTATAVGNTTTANTIKNTALKVCVDQVVFAPVVVSLYFTIMGLMQRKSLNEVKEDWQEHFVPTLLLNWTVWPMFQLVNFSLIPVGSRLIAVNIMSLGWNMFLSHRYSQTNNKKLLLELEASK